MIVTFAAASAAAVAGAIVGSFLATLCVRWPNGEQALTGRSHCDGCGRTLRAYELVPVLSAVSARGRCRTCGQAIDPLHTQIEVAAAALAAAAVALQPNLQGAALAAFWLLLLAPAVLDWRHYWLPDSLTVAVGAGGLLLGGLATATPLVDRIIGGAAGFVALGAVALAYRRTRGREGLGLGDPKLFGAIGLWTGWVALAPVLLIAALCGLAVALMQRKTGADRMPFGTFLAFAAIVWTGAGAAGVALP